jgi:hypothetical protein
MDPFRGGGGLRAFKALKAYVERGVRVKIFWAYEKPIDENPESNFTRISKSLAMLVSSGAIYC